MTAPPRVFFRADSSADIGSGHIYRCLVLANTFAKLGIVPTFISKKFAGNFNNIIVEAGFNIHEIDSSLSQLDDSQFCINLLESRDTDILIIDNYSLDVEFEKNASSFAKTLVFDDLLPRKHQSDYHLDQNFFLDQDHHPAHKLNPTAIKMLGPQYALIRDSFRQLKKVTSITQETGNLKFLVFFGGSDPTGETLRFLEQTSPLNLQGIEVLVAVSGGNQHLSQIKNFNPPAWLKIFIQPPNFPELMSQTHVYFGSGGSITWERMFLGLPGFVISVAENQVEMSEQLAKANLQTYLGTCANLDYGVTFKDIVESLDLDNLADQAERGSLLVDGLGAKRVVDQLLGKKS